MKGANEPSHALCDLAAATYQKDQLSRIEWKDGPRLLNKGRLTRPLKTKGFKRTLIAFKTPLGILSRTGLHFATAGTNWHYRGALLEI